MKKIFYNSICALSILLHGCSTQNSNKIQLHNIAISVSVNEISNTIPVNLEQPLTLDDIVNLNDVDDETFVSEIQEYYNILSNQSTEKLIKIATTPFHSQAIMTIFTYRNKEYFDQRMKTIQRQYNDIKIAYENQKPWRHLKFKREHNDYIIINSPHTTSLEEIKNGEIFSCLGNAIGNARLLYDNGYLPYMLLMINDNDSNYEQYISHVVMLIKEDDQFATLGAMSAIGFSTNNTIKSIITEINERLQSNYSKYIIINLDDVLPDWQENDNYKNNNPIFYIRAKDLIRIN